ncbi:hypothetical protein DEU56DRAFT_770649 [Suillus clintonianus]|uniref:uncharacterized protein n=1 Tax=Suillus clintonianus TaxID=1904413 RepID=UPI001B860F19|nr:uncharacterized protein DEU56DRAFT_770649 [Suillus clintonianus]KAG2154824.1 hypothetical protein DEU56DRAFT_770649 [Suillus clintonianus]
MACERESSVAPRLGGNTALVTFVAVIFAFVGETRLTQYVQTTLGYQHSFFLFYVVHSSFAISFPLHLGYLLLTTRHSPRALLSGLSSAITAQLTPQDPRSIRSSQFPLSRFLVVILTMTAVYSIPALLWFIAVVYAPVTDVTAIWNANAFFAYVFSVKLLNLNWSLVRMCAVCLATAGVLTIVYGDSTPSSTTAAMTVALTPSPFFGDILTLVASVIYGLYQVLYTKYAALPSDPKLVAESAHYTHVPASAEQADDQEIVSPPLVTNNEFAYSLPFGLHPNFLTASIGVCTLFVFWVPLPVLHYYGIEEFALPSDMVTFAAIAGICATGVIFNAGFMILLGVWGPIVTSVGSLLTIVLTLISDLMLGSVGLTAGGLLGAGMIVGAFAVLAYDVFQS